MTASKSALVAGLLTALAVCGSPALATPMLTNLIVNPGAEANVGAGDFVSTVVPTGWTTFSNFTAVRYAIGGALDLNAADGASVGGGSNYFAGGNANAAREARQSISLLDLAASIDAGEITAALSALIGGYFDQSDNMVVQAIFLDGLSSTLGVITLGPATVVDRNSESSLLGYSDNALVPFGTRSVDIVMTATRINGDYNDGYADNLSFVLRGGATTPVPLSGTLSLAALGLAGCLARKRHKR